MFSDAKDDGLLDENMFARLGHKKNAGREDITVLTRAEVERLARIAERVHGGDFGLEFGAMIEWAAYTGMIYVPEPALEAIRRKPWRLDGARVQRLMRSVSWAHMAISTRFRAPSLAIRLAR